VLSAEERRQGRRSELRLTVYTDGASEPNPGPSGIGVVVVDEDGSVLSEVSRDIGPGTNNRAEYFGVGKGIHEAARHGATDILVRSDSRLVVEQLSGRWKVKNPHLRQFHARILRLVSELGVRVTFEQVPREQNVHADRLANGAIGVEGNTFQFRKLARSH
jgi:ribonuclease HI